MTSCFSFATLSAAGGEPMFLSARWVNDIFLPHWGGLGGGLNLGDVVNSHVYIVFWIILSSKFLKKIWGIFFCLNFVTKSFFKAKEAKHCIFCKKARSTWLVEIFPGNLVTLLVLTRKVCFGNGSEEVGGDEFSKARCGRCGGFTVGGFSGTTDNHKTLMLHIWFFKLRPSLISSIWQQED